MKKAILLIWSVSWLASGHYALIGEPLHKLGLDDLKNELRVEEAQKQEKEFPGKITGEKAVALALESFLNDASDIESPLALATQLALEDLNLSCDQAKSPKVVKRAKAILYSHFNRYSSEIRFLSLGEEPEHGEKTSQNWIVRLKISTLSDHIFWAIIERNGKVSPYNYGFN